MGEKSRTERGSKSPKHKFFKAMEENPISKSCNVQEFFSCLGKPQDENRSYLSVRDRISALRDSSKRKKTRESSVCNKSQTMRRTSSEINGLTRRTSAKSQEKNKGVLFNEPVSPPSLQMMMKTAHQITSRIQPNEKNLMSTSCKLWSTTQSHQNSKKIFKNFKNIKSNNQNILN